MNQIERIMAIAEHYADGSWHRKPVAEIENRHQALRAAIEQALKPGEAVAWQERQAKRMKDGQVTEWSNWYPCRYRSIDEAKNAACDQIPYEWRPLYTAPQPQPKQEPFGYFRAEPFGWTDCAETDDGAIPLFEAPQPQREWVGLTDEEIQAIEDNTLEGGSFWDVYRAIEAKLKEKNT